LLKSEAVDLVLLDIAMPGIDGCGLCGRMQRELPQPPPVLMITGLVDAEMVDQAFQAGAIDYIRKPIFWPVLKNRLRYILEAHRGTQELARLNRNYEAILNSAADGIIGLEGSGLISYVNPAAERLLGMKGKKVLGSSYRKVLRFSLPGTDQFDFDCCAMLHEPEGSGHHAFEELRLQRRDGTRLLVDCRVTAIRGRKGDISGAVLLLQDATERQQAAELVRHMANHDALTNLPNRNYFTRRLPQAISLAKRQQRQLCLLFIDLDRFKPVNDQYGHGVGDHVLLEVARRLESMLRSSDSVCRLGGDEFVILLESSDDLLGARQVALKVIETLNIPIVVDDISCSIGASIGISVYPLDSGHADEMLRHADIAMYRAKEKGRNRVEVYHQEESEDESGGLGP